MRPPRLRRGPRWRTVASGSSTRAKTQTRFWPKKDPRKPVRGITRTIAMRYEVETQVISSRVAPTVPRISGSATVTIDVSTAAMSEPKPMAIVTIHLFTGWGRARAIGTPRAVTVTSRLRAETWRRRGRSRSRTTLPRRRGAEVEDPAEGWTRVRRPKGRPGRHAIAFHECRCG